MQIIIWGADENVVVANIPLLSVPIDPDSMEQVNEAVATAEAAKDAAVDAAAQAGAAAEDLRNVEQGDLLTDIPLPRRVRAFL